jgi:uncharacterized repeat protein (TIGR03803 family)
LLTTLHSFCSQPSCADGGQPLAGLIQGTDGNFYGTTSEGGTGVLSGGTVFEITSAGALTTIYSFCSQTNCTDGSTPFAGVIQATDGNFYGTTFGGWDDPGTIFKITPRGKLTTLHSFNGMDGSGPSGALVQATDGNLYGTTNWGGAGGEGTVFKITPSGKMTTLHSFTGRDSSTANSLIQAADGNLYGTTYGGFENDYGTVFKITLGGKLKTLYRFCSQDNCTDGNSPAGPLVQATDRNLYGTTNWGGDNGLGTVFRLSTRK